MKTESIIRAIAGTFILVSLLLSQLHHPYWLYFTAFIGLNLFQSAFTQWCLMEDLLKHWGIGKDLKNVEVSGVKAPGR